MNFRLAENEQVLKLAHKEKVVIFVNFLFSFFLFNCAVKCPVGQLLFNKHMKDDLTNCLTVNSR